MNSEEIKQSYGMEEIARKYGAIPNRSKMIVCPFHKDRTPSMKLYPQSFYCFGCGATGDIFTYIEKLTGMTFREVYEMLGGSQKKTKMSFSSYVKVKQEKSKRQHTQRTIIERKKQLQLTQRMITAYRTLIEEIEPFSDLWCYCQNKLLYQYYILEYETERREVHGGN